MNVIVERSGDVIPGIVGPAPSAELVAPVDHLSSWKVCCPCAKAHPIEPPQDSAVDVFCTHPSCPERQVHRILHFASRNALNISGML
jgi:DNA ligase (NAD+)